MKYILRGGRLAEGMLMDVDGTTGWIDHVLEGCIPGHRSRSRTCDRITIWNGFDSIGVTLFKNFSIQIGFLSLGCMELESHSDFCHLLIGDLLLGISLQG